MPFLFHIVIVQSNTVIKNVRILNIGPFTTTDTSYKTLHELPVPDMDAST